MSWDVGAWVVNTLKTLMNTSSEEQKDLLNTINTTINTLGVPISATNFNVTADNATTYTTVVNVSGKGYIDLNYAVKNRGNKIKVVIDGKTIINGVTFSNLPSAETYAATDEYYNARMHFRFNTNVTISINRTSTGASNTGFAHGFVFLEE